MGGRRPLGSEVPPMKNRLIRALPVAELLTASLAAAAMG